MRRALLFETLEERVTPSITIQIDYSYDTNDFFNTPAKKQIMQQAADTVAASLNNSLAAITPSGNNIFETNFTNPGTGAYIDNSSNPPGETIPANTLIVYVGGQPLPGNILGEGAPGGFSNSGSQDFIQTNANRVAPGFCDWGGWISFNSAIPDWYFGLSPSGISLTQYDFFSVAEHELGHVLGFGTALPFTNLTNYMALRQNLWKEYW